MEKTNFSEMLLEQRTYSGDAENLDSESFTPCAADCLPRMVFLAL
jgi:hypothetical protein